MVPTLLAAISSCAATLLVLSLIHLRNSDSSSLVAAVSHHEVESALPIHRPDDIRCGSSAEEARQLGCTFDQLSIAWLRPECSRHGQQEFIDSAGNETTYRYWRDKSASDELDLIALSELRPGEQYWTSQREHLSHCMWLLLRVHHAWESGERLDGLSRRYMHSKHCLRMMVHMAEQDGNDLDAVIVSGDVGFGVC